MRRDNLGKICWNLCKRPIVLLIFLVILFICSDKFNFISNIKPRCFWNRLCLNGFNSYLTFILKNLWWKVFIDVYPNFSAHPNPFIEYGLPLKSVECWINFCDLSRIVYWKDMLIEYSANFDGNLGFVLFLVPQTSTCLFPVTIFLINYVYKKTIFVSQPQFS